MLSQPHPRLICHIQFQNTEMATLEMSSQGFRTGLYKPAGDSTVSIFYFIYGWEKRSCEKKTFTGFFFTSKAKNRKEVIYHDYHVHSEFKTVFYKTTALKLEPIRQFTATSGYGWKAIVWNACLRQLRLWFLHRRVMWTQTNTYYAEHQCRALRDVRLREAYPGTHNYTLIQLKPLWDLENMLWLVPADLEDLLNAQFSIFM